MTNQPTPNEFIICNNLETQLDLEPKEINAMNIIIAQTQSVELDGSVTKAATIAAVENLKSYAQLSTYERERLSQGDPIACDSCFKPGVWNPDELGVDSIAQSEYTLEDDSANYVYVCNSCESERELMHEAELAAEFEAHFENLQARIDGAITAMRNEARSATFELLRHELADFWDYRLDELMTEFVHDNEIDMSRIDNALLEPEDLDIGGSEDFVSYSTKSRLELATEIELSDYEYDFRELVDLSADYDYTKLANCLIDLYVYDAVRWSGAFIKDYLENN